MVKKEYYKTLEDGTVLVRTYSDNSFTDKIKAYTGV